MTNRIWQQMLATLLATILPFANAAAQPRIVPLQTSAKFSTHVPKSRWTASIKSTDGSPAYVLSLEPDFDVAHHVVTLELVLRRAADQSNAPNLLDPTGGRHGLQAYDFAASDFARGVQKSEFGQNRTVRLQDLGLVMQITVSNVTVSPISNSGYQIEGLDLRIKVANSKS